MFNEFKLDDLINLQSDGFNEQKVIRLAFVSKNAVHLEEEVVELLEKYGKNEVGFVGIYGRKGAGKSVLFDKVINLCEFEGTQVPSSSSLVCSTPTPRAGSLSLEHTVL
jgi:ABC-type lipopolysaccharide export system ATPase subunit